MWPHAPHRVLRSCVEAAEAVTDDIVGEMFMGAMQMPVKKFSVLPPTRGTKGTVEAMALLRGRVGGAVTAIVPAAEVVRELADGAERLLRAATS